MVEWDTSVVYVAEVISRDQDSNPVRDTLHFPFECNILYVLSSTYHPCIRTSGSRLVIELERMLRGEEELGGV